MEEHQLRREIVVTQIVNQLVNNAGITYFHRLVGETSATTAELTRANFVAREIFGADRLQRPDRLLRQPARRRGADPHAAGAPHPRRAGLALAAEQPADRRGHRGGGRRLRGRGGEGDGRAAVADGRPRARGLRAASRRARREGGARGPRRPGGGVPAGVHDPRAWSRRPPATTATRWRSRGCTSRSASGSGCRCWSPGSSRCRATDRWQTMARAALRDDLHAVHAQLTAQELAGHAADPGKESSRPSRTLAGDLRRRRTPTSRGVSVALRVVRTLPVGARRPR